MALLAGRPRPPALIGARRDRGGQGKNPPAATDRSPPQHQLLVSSPFPPPLPLLHRNGQLHGRRTSLFVTLAAAAAQAGSDGQQQQPQQKQMFQQRLAAAQASKKKKPPLPARLLSSFLATSSVPYSSYVPEPATLLHRVHARAKLFLLLATLLLAARSPPGARAALAGAVAAATLAVLPARLALPQLRRVLAIAGFIFFLTAIGAESVPPPLQSRCPPGVEAGLAACPPAIAGGSGIGTGGIDGMLAAAFSSSSSSSSSTLPSVDFAALAAAAEEAAASSKTRGYSYVVFHFLFVTVTRRSLRLATSAAATCLLALQGSSLVLTTTPAEDAALALCTLPSWRLKRWNRRRKKKGEEEGNEDDETDSSSSSSPFEVVRRPANRTALTLLLSLRFLALVFDEARGLALGLAARGIDWEGLGSGGGISVGLRLVTRLFGNLQARAGDVAVAMTARGFAGPGLHIVHPAPVSEGGGGREGDGSATKRRSARVSFGATLGAVLLACAALARAAVSSPA